MSQILTEVGSTSVCMSELTDGALKIGALHCV